MKRYSPGLVKSCFAELRNAWMLQNYFAVVESEVASGVNANLDDAVATSSIVAAIGFKPEISVSELNNEEAGKVQSLCFQKCKRTISRVYKQKWKRH